MRVDWSIKDADFIVQVRSSAASALANVTNGITAVDQLAGAHGKAGEMSV